MKTKKLTIITIAAFLLSLPGLCWAQTNEPPADIQAILNGGVSLEEWNAEVNASSAAYKKLAWTPASHFKYDLTQDGKGVNISEYIGSNDTSIVIPNVIEGMPVLELNGGEYGIFGDGPFPKVKKIVFPPNIENVSRVENLNLPNMNTVDMSYAVKVTHLPYEMCNAPRVSKVLLPPHLLSISEGAFENTVFQSISIPDSVISIGNEAFSNSKLRSVTLPPHLMEFANAFERCNNLTQVTIPSGITLIDEGAFSYCKNLTSITIPDTVTVIKGAAFIGTGLTSITIPSSVKEVESASGIWGAFGGCKSLKEVNYTKGATHFDSKAFSECTGLPLNVRAALGQTGY
jgi:hypothetical protein